MKNAKKEPITAGEALRKLKTMMDDRSAVNTQLVFNNPGAAKEQKPAYVLSKKDLWRLFDYYAAKAVKESNSTLEAYEINNVVLTVLKYMIQDPEFNVLNMVKNTPSLQKGLLIHGPYGVGKSMLFSILQNVGRELATKRNCTDIWFTYITANDLVQRYMDAAKNEKGADNVFSIENYYKGVLFIDDLGHEEKAFNKTELIGQLLFERHRRGAKTHVTTNFPPSEISQRYGAFIGDRLPQMFNFIKWNGNTKRGV
ncbi:IstB-like ATP binding protein [Thalassospira sp. 11-3]|nr:IstB-like ATP binding protein [Thalassospira sp. 11-3]